MAKTIIIHEDRIEVLEDGYNIIEKTIYDPTLVQQADNLLNELKEELS